MTAARVSRALILAIARLLNIFGCAVALRELERINLHVLTLTFGLRSVTVWTGWIGVSLHELSHLVLCPIFFHRVKECTLFRDEPDEEGCVGRVRHAYNPRNPWAALGNGLIGVAPLFLGALAIYGAMRCLLKVPTPLAAASPLWAEVHIMGLLSALFRNTEAPRLLAFLYVCLAIGSHQTPSSSDLQGAWSGLGLLTAALVVASVTGQGWPGLVVRLLWLDLLACLTATVAVLLLAALVGLWRRSMGELLAPLAPRLAVVSLVLGAFLWAGVWNGP